MNQYLEAFAKGAIRGARETPREFFRPLIVLGRLLVICLMGISRGLSWLYSPSALKKGEPSRPSTELDRLKH